MDLKMHFRFLIIWFSFFAAVTAMFGKRLGPDPELSSGSAAKKLKANIADLFLSNDISAKRAQTFFQQAAAAGLHEMHSVGKTGSPKNVHRNLLKKLLKGNKWPDLYYAPVRFWNAHEQRVETCMLPFLLPHELIHDIHQHSTNEAGLFSTEGMGQATKEHIVRAAQELAKNPGEIIGLGIWGDGTPCNWDRTQSLETWSLNFPGLTDQMGQLRVPLTSINKKFVVKGETHDDILEVIVWSLNCLVSGEMPSADHLGQPLVGTKRVKAAKQLLPCAILAEVRADWALLKGIFRFPQHNEKDGTCWQCEAKPADLRCCASDARWRTARLDHWGLLKRMMDKGLKPSPIMSAPCVRSSIFLVDWLHCADQGVSADFLGSYLLFLSKKFPGRGLAAQIKEMYKDIKTWYRSNNIEARLDDLKPSMLKKDEKNSKPKLRSKAAECRALIPYALDSANRLLDASDPLEASITQATVHLNACYSNLSADAFNAAHMKENSLKFCLLYVALEARDKRFCIKPKLHLFMELTQLGNSCPSLFWTYRDEDFGGFVAQISKKRGGFNKPGNTAKSVLLKFISKHSLPRFV